MRKLLWQMHVTVMMMTVLSTGPVAGKESAPGVQSGYPPVNGLKMYYEIHGTADGKDPPLVLLHGRGSTIDHIPKGPTVLSQNAADHRI